MEFMNEKDVRAKGGPWLAGGFRQPADGLSIAPHLTPGRVHVNLVFIALACNPSRLSYLYLTPSAGLCLLYQSSPSLPEGLFFCFWLVLFFGSRRIYEKKKQKINKKQTHNVTCFLQFHNFQDKWKVILSVLIRQTKG